MTCHCTNRETKAECGQTLIEVAGIYLCPECDRETIAQIRTKAF